MTFNGFILEYQIHSYAPFPQSDSVSDVAKKTIIIVYGAVSTQR